MTMFGLYTRVYLNSYTQEYETILTIDRMPDETSPLKNIVRHLRLPSLSPFQPRGRYACSNTNPVYGILSLMNPVPGSTEWMTPAEIPALFSFLMENGYVINTELTRMINDGPVSGWASSADPGVSGSLIAYVTKTNV
jgi:hypothetical protein